VRLQKLDICDMAMKEGAICILETIVEETQEKKGCKEKAIPWKLAENMLVKVVGK